MSCKTCGCAEINVSSGCSNCGTPYYKSCSTCPEDHTQLLVEDSVSPAITVKTGFNIPACGQNAVVQVPGLKRIGIGSRIWADTFGFLRVISFDVQSESITVTNDCLSCNADAGTTVPACTVFTVDAPPCGGEDSSSANGPRLSSDFVIPAEDGCVTVEVTTVDGLSVGKDVSIAGNQYLLQTILDSDHITICNKGAGGTPGTTIFAKDDADNLQYPVVLIDANPCTNDAVTSGKIIACKDDVMQPLEGSTDGEVPVWDDTDKVWVPKTLLIPTGDCTSLTVCLVVDPANGAGHSYVALVADTSNFSPGDLVVIGGAPAHIDTIDSATQMHVIFVEDPGAVFTYAVGVAVCDANCCDVINDTLGNACALMDLLDIDGGSDVANVADTDTADLTSGQTATGDIATVTIPNNSGCRNMVVQVTYTFLWGSQAVGDPYETVRAGFHPLVSFDVADVGMSSAGAPALPMATPLRHGFHFHGTGEDGGGVQTGKETIYYDQVFTWTENYVLLPGKEVQCKAAAKIEFLNGDGDKLTYDQLSCRISHHEITD